MEVCSDFQALVGRVQAGDAGAMADLIETYDGALLRSAEKLVGKFLRSHLDALDLVQSVHLILWRGLCEGKLTAANPKALLALAKVVLRRVVARHWRAAKQQMTSSLDANLLDTVVDRPLMPACPQPTPAKSTELEDLLRSFVEPLGELDRQLIKLRCQGYTTADAARVLHVEPGSLRVRLGRLRERFAQFRLDLTTQHS